ncbi:uncharacterized protein RB166_019613 [Leptodactylus fuscus]
MGVLQMAESELSGNTISKELETSRKSSTESNQSPKAAQQSCLRGALIRIFPKRAEPNNTTAEDQASNQSTKDQEGGRGKRRRVSGSIFRLPCLRPAETTANDIQDKPGEPSHDVIQEEELKPYSKASFLRKIRCYRLMREKDATEKEKVAEMAQRKHDKENAEVKQHKERVLEQREEGPQSMNHDEAGKDTMQQEQHAKTLEVAGNDFQEHVEEPGSSRKQESCMEKLPEEESEKIEDPAQGLEGTGQDLVGQEGCDETLQNKSALLEGEVNLVEDKSLAEQQSQIDEIDGARDQEEVVLEQKSLTAKLEDLDVGQPEQVGKQEKPKPEEDEGTNEKDLPMQESQDSVRTNTESRMEKTIPEDKCHRDEGGDAGNHLSEEEGHTDKVEHTTNNLSGQQCAEEDTRNSLPDQGGQEEMKEKDMAEQGDIVDNLENNEGHGDKEDHVETGDESDQKNNLDSQVENTWEKVSQEDSQDIVKTRAETLEELEDNPVEVSEVSLDIQEEKDLTNMSSNEGLAVSTLNKEPVTCQLQDLPLKKTLDSEDNEELLTSVKKKTTPNNILTSASSEEEHTQVLGLQKEVLISPNTIDLTYQDSDIRHTCVSNEDNGTECEGQDLDSLKVEVQDMVEWMVQEASDRLSVFTDESEGTG